MQNSAGAAVFCSPGFSRASKTDYGSVPRYFVYREGHLRDRGHKQQKMNAHKPNEILDCPLQQLELSNELKRAMNSNQIKTMREILHYTTQEVEHWPGFHIQLVHEYINYLEQAGLGEWIDRY